MNETRDTNETATADDGGELDHQQAARLLDQTTRDAQRQFDTTPPLITLIRGPGRSVGGRRHRPLHRGARSRRRHRLAAPRMIVRA
jgi:hypothetical protein